MKSNELRLVRRSRRKKGIRKRLYGTSERPRLTVFRSLKNIYAQIIDDEKGVTICEANTRGKEIRDGLKYGGNAAAAKIVGVELAKKALARKITQVCFDRNGFRFHGRLKSLADAAREAGLKF